MHSAPTTPSSGRPRRVTQAADFVPGSSETVQHRQERARELRFHSLDRRMRAPIPDAKLEAFAVEISQFFGEAIGAEPEKYAVLAAPMFQELEKRFSASWKDETHPVHARFADRFTSPTET
jgi:hypothetical protein